MPNVVRFDSYEADLAAGQLRKHGVRLNLRDQSFQVLAALLENAGEVVSREALRRRLWRDEVFVDFENSLNTAVARLREALCDSADHPRFIETLPRRGYRFLAKVGELNGARISAPLQRARLVVLPFLNLTGEPAQEYFTDAMTDELITALAALAPQQMAVIARTTAMHYKGTHKDVARIARELKVDYMLEGSVRNGGDRIAVNVQLIEAASQEHRFARRYEAEASEVFQLQTSIAHAVAAHIPSIADKVRAAQITKPPTNNLAAYNAYIKGRYEMWKWTPDAVAKAKQHYEAALRLDPKFALACDGLANLYGYLGLWGFLPPDEAEPLRWFYGLRAFELDSDLAEPRTHVAYHPQKREYQGGYSYNWQEAEQVMAQARDMNPSSPLIRVRHAAVLLTIGRTEEAAREAECALEFDPLSMEVHFWLVQALLVGRQYERALAQAQKMLELEPEHQVCYMQLGQVYLGMKEFAESIAAFRRAAELTGEFPLMLGWLGLALGLGGHKDEAHALLERLRALAATQFVLPTSFAWIHLGLGQIDKAFTWMERAADGNDEWIHPLKGYSFLDPLRNDPRYHRLVRKLNLDNAAAAVAR